MKRFITIFFLLINLAFANLSTASNLQDEMLNRGLNALDKVDYDTAFLEFILGTEMGYPTFQHNLAILYRNELETGTHI